MAAIRFASSFASSAHSHSASSNYIRAYSPQELDYLYHLRILNYGPALICWLEKFILLIDYFQLFGVIWNASQPWPWPYLWIQYTRYFNLINLDFYIFTKTGALNGQTNNFSISKWGEMPGYLNYGMAYAILAILAVLSFRFFTRPIEIYGQSFIQKRTSILASLGYFLYFIYLPCSLAVFRLYYCEHNIMKNNDFVLAVDPSIQCGTYPHLAYIIVSILFISPLFFGFPYIIYTSIKKNSIYHNNLDHEKKLQIWEIQYMLSLDSYWMDERVWLISSYRRFGSFLPFHMLLLKALVVIFFVFIRPNMIAQSSVYMVLFFCFGIYYTIYKLPYRTLSSNAIFLCVMAMLIFNTTFGMANASGARNPVMTASTETLILASFNFIIIMCIVAIFVLIAIAPTVLDWPTLYTMERIYHNRELLPKVAKWVEVLRESKMVRNDFLVSPVEISDVKALEECIRLLRSCWLTARSLGSIFENILSEALEELLYIHSSRHLYALRKHDKWDTAYIEAVENKAFSKRRERTYLMQPLKRKMLVKLLAYRYLRGDRGKFDIAVAIEYEKNLKFQGKNRPLDYTFIYYV